MTQDQDERRRLLDAGVREVPPAGAEEQIWRALTTRLEQPLSASAEAARRSLEATASPAPAGLTLTKAVAAMASVSAVVATLLFAVPSAQRATQPAPEAPGISAPPGTGAPDAGALLVGDASLPIVTTPLAPATSTLLAETGLVAAAQRALQQHNPAAALELVERHALEFPSGLLAEDRDALRVLALCGLERTHEAGAARRDFAQAWPSSPLLARVRMPCRRTGPAH